MWYSFSDELLRGPTFGLPVLGENSTCFIKKCCRGSGPEPIYKTTCYKHLLLSHYQTEIISGKSYFCKLGTPKLLMNHI